MKKLTSIEYIERIKKIHNNEYDYSKCNYINNRIKICIICQKHGEFWQNPKHHLRGQGCPKCSVIKSSNNRKLITEEFIEKAKKIHGDKFNYLLSCYMGYNIKVKVICPIHGEFQQTPKSHLKGNGCLKCGIKKQITTIEYITKAIKKHNNKFDYSKCDYKGSHEKIEIICPKHGSFFQIAGDHLFGIGCSKCHFDKISNNFRYEIGEFINMADNVHEKEYDYSKSNYIGCYDEIEIICPKHGSFFQKPYIHLQKHGCPYCFHIISKLEKEFLNYNNIPNTKKTRQLLISRKKVDGFDPKTNTVYEFLGDYFHGNPQRFNSNDYNQICHKTFGELYDETFKRLKLLKDNGYNVCYIWEWDWKLFKKGIDEKLKLQFI